MHYLETLTFDWIEILRFSRRPFRAKYIPAKIWKDLDKYRNDISGLVNYFKKWKFRVIQIKPLTKNSKYIPVGGCYWPDDNCSELHLCVEDFNSFVFTDATWNRFKYKVLQVSMHELIHCRQYMDKREDYSPSKVSFSRTGISKIDEIRHYHSGRDEIEAYAHCIYLDFKVYKPRIPVRTLIRRCHTHNDSPTLRAIINVFGSNPTNNEIFPILFRKILMWERKINEL